MVVDVREMKDSYIINIDKIPENWVIPKIGYYYTFRSGDTLTSIDIDEIEGKYIVYGANGIRGYYSKYNTSGKHILLGRVGALCGNVHIVDGQNWVTEHALILSKLKNCSDEYFGYLFETMNLGQYSKASAQPVISVDTISNLRCIAPSIEEQKKIASFLDTKCSEIDSLAADIQAQIDTLEQYKRSVITEAVTKGLNKNVPMKDSNVEWIGEIPESWSVSKLGNVLHLRSERNYKPLEEVNLISLYTDKGVVQHSDLEKTSGNIAQNADGYKIVHKDDIVVNIILAWMGAMGISKYDGVTSPAYDVYEINQNKIVPHYCHYILRSPAMAGECYKYGRGIMLMRWRTYSTEFKKIKMPLPSLQEQQLIADYLDNKCAEIDSIITDKQKQLEILDEYKKSLIYEYVTGKKEVPNE